MFLSEKYTLIRIKPITKQISKDGTAKFGFSLHDGKLIEGVLIPADDRLTACISSQVGCAMGCKFCATAKLGFKRNLSKDEIYDQAYHINEYAKETHGKPLNNIVYMGMGEPFMNFENMLDSVNLLTSNDGMAFSSKRITISTVGITENIKKFADSGCKARLAISLHHADNEQRSEIVPLNKRHNLEDLKEALKYYIQKTGNKITFEYVLLAGVTDRLEDAKHLVKFCSNFNCKVNLIEFNQNELSPYQKSNPTDVDIFLSYLNKKNIIALLRNSRGEDIDGACGQLANKYEKLNQIQ